MALRKSRVSEMVSDGVAVVSSLAPLLLVFFFRPKVWPNSRFYSLALRGAFAARRSLLPARATGR